MNAVLVTLLLLCLLVAPVPAARAVPLPHLRDEVPASLINFGISPDGRYLVFTEEFPPPRQNSFPTFHLQLFDLQRLELRTLRKEVNGYNRILFESADRFAFSDTGGGITLMSAADGSTLQQLNAGPDHALCNGRRLVQTEGGAVLLSATHEPERLFRGTGSFVTAVCTSERALLIFIQEAHLLNAADWSPICTIPARYGSITSYKQGALLGSNRLALLDHWSGMALYDACAAGSRVAGYTMVMAHADELLLGHAGVIQGRRNSTPAPGEVGIRRFDGFGRHLGDIPVPDVLWQMELHPARPDILVTLAKDGPFRFVNRTTGRALTLVLQRNTGHWLLYDDSGAYQASPGSDAELYFTEGPRISALRPAPFAGNLYRRFLEQQP